MLYLDFNYLVKKHLLNEACKSAEQVIPAAINRGLGRRSSALRIYQNYLRDFLKKAKVDANLTEFDNIA